MTMFYLIHIFIKLSFYSINGILIQLRFHLLKSKYKFQNMKVPRFDIIASSIKAKTVEPELSNEDEIQALNDEIEDLEKKNQFLQMLVEMYESNPLKINAYVVCESKLLMNMIKLLTDCEKVDLVLDEDIGCSGCTAKSSKIIYVSKILVTKDGKTSELKYDYNNIYSEFVKYGISLKMTY